VRQLGYTGKVPHRGDFVRHNVPTLLHRVWNDWLAATLATMVDTLDDWPAGYDAAPVWRFALSPDIAGEDARAGVLIASRDGVGRRFPFALLATLPPDATALDPFAPGAKALDALETLARRAVDDARAFDTLAETLESLQGSLVDATPTGEWPPFRAGAVAEEAEPAVFCEDATLLADRDGACRLLDAGLRQSTGPYSVWQRRERAPGEGRLLVTGGMPSGPTAPVLFGADWPAHAGGRLLARIGAPDRSASIDIDVPEARSPAPPDTRTASPAPASAPAPAAAPATLDDLDTLATRAPSDTDTVPRRRSSATDSPLDPPTDPPTDPPPDSAPGTVTTAATSPPLSEPLRPRDAAAAVTTRSRATDPPPIAPQDPEAEPLELDDDPGDAPWDRP